jgi:hypothetical protein
MVKRVEGWRSGGGMVDYGGECQFFEPRGVGEIFFLEF